MTSNRIVFYGLILLIGIISGISGTSLQLLLHEIQHIAFGYSLHTIIGPESFLQGVQASTALRRVMVLTLCGLIAGLGWYVIYRFGKPIINISQALHKKRPSMPFFTTLLHVLLQIITIGLGSPLGREVAPRELSGLLASKITKFTHLSAKESRILFACAAGGGLAAVYNVPLSGAIFTLEVLLCTWRFPVLIPAFITSIIAVLISWIGLGKAPQYQISIVSINTSLVVWSMLMGPIFGLAAFWFKKIADIAHHHLPHFEKIPIFCLLNFFIIGVLAISFPELLGNGKSPTQLAFGREFGVQLAFLVLILHTLTVWSSLWAGAHGGLLTPSLANGALLAVVLGGAWNAFAPTSELNTYALIGAAAFLAEAQSMPITAFFLLFELTHPSFYLLIPTFFAILGSVGIGKMLNRRDLHH